jgi:prepilin-type processing-associated H-X9-DG protein
MPFDRSNDFTDAVPVVKGPTVGKFMAIWVPGGLLFFIFMAWLWIRPDLNGGETTKQTEGCLSNLRELARGFQMYAADNNDILPGPAADGKTGWTDELKPLLHKVPDEELLFACPVQRRLDPESSGYELNQDAASQKLSDLGPQNQLVLIFDSKNVGTNALGPTSDMPSPGRHDHGRKNNFVYADGSAKTVDAK